MKQTTGGCLGSLTSLLRRLPISFITILTILSANLPAQLNASPLEQYGFLNEVLDQSKDADDLELQNKAVSCAALYMKPDRGRSKGCFESIDLDECGGIEFWRCEQRKYFVFLDIIDASRNYINRSRQSSSGDNGKVHDNLIRGAVNTIDAEKIRVIRYCSSTKNVFAYIQQIPELVVYWNCLSVESERTMLLSLDLTEVIKGQ
jgi:hypothetical protein